MSIVRRIDGVTGKDWWAWHFLPRSLALRYLAKRIAAHHNIAKDTTLPAGEHVFTPPDGVGMYTILNGRGDYQPHKMEIPSRL